MYAPIVKRLLQCLIELDQAGEAVAAAHLDAAIQALEHGPLPRHADALHRQMPGPDRKPPSQADAACL